MAFGLLDQLACFRCSDLVIQPSLPGNRSRPSVRRPPCSSLLATTSARASSAVTGQVVSRPTLEGSTRGRKHRIPRLSIGNLTVFIPYRVVQGQKRSPYLPDGPRRRRRVPLLLPVPHEAGCC